MTEPNDTSGTMKWSVWTVYYNAPRDDQRLKAGSRTRFQASSLAEVREKLDTRGIDVTKHKVEAFREHFTQASWTEVIEPATLPEKV